MLHLRSQQIFAALHHAVKLGALRSALAQYSSRINHEVHSLDERPKDCFEC
jgi:hypothetical protein